MSEILKDLPQYEGFYKVSNKGNLFRILKSGKLKEVKGAINNKGYRIVHISKNNISRVYSVHQLVAMAFLNHNVNKWDNVVDHIDHNKLNNNVENLQILSHRENVSKRQKEYSSKHIGVTWHKKAKKWVAQATKQGEKRKYLGLFKTENEATEAIEAYLLKN